MIEYDGVITTVNSMLKSWTARSFWFRLWQKEWFLSQQPLRHEINGCKYVIDLWLIWMFHNLFIVFLSFFLCFFSTGAVRDYYLVEAPHGKNQTTGIVTTKQKEEGPSTNKSDHYHYLQPYSHLDCFISICHLQALVSKVSIFMHHLYVHVLCVYFIKAIVIFIILLYECTIWNLN